MMGAHDAQTTSTARESGSCFKHLEERCDMSFFDKVMYMVPSAIVFVIDLFLIAKTRNWFLRKNGIITVIAFPIAWLISSVLTMGCSAFMTLFALWVRQNDMDPARYEGIISKAADYGGDAMVWAALVCFWVMAKDNADKEAASIHACSN